MDDCIELIALIIAFATVTFTTIHMCQRSEKSKENVQDQWICETNENWNSTGTYQWKLTE